MMLVSCLVLTSTLASAEGLTVGSSTVAEATASSSQRRNITDTLTGTSWVFWLDGSAIAYASSRDGITWTPEGTLGHATTAFSVSYAAIGGVGYVFVALASTVDLGDVVLLRGALTADSVSFDPPVTVLDGTGVGDAYVRPTVATDASGTVWVAAQYDDGTDYQAVARQTTNPGDGDLSVLEAVSNVGGAGSEARDTVLVPQGGTRMALALGAPDVALFTYDGVTTAVFRGWSARWRCSMAMCMWAASSATPLPTLPRISSCGGMARHGMPLTWGSTVPSTPWQ
jgi:hypothetical protein